MTLARSQRMVGSVRDATSTSQIRQGRDWLMSFIGHATLLLTLTMTQAHSGPRLPLDVPCDGNHLTIYAGRVVKLARHTARAVVSIRTDEATIESVTLKHPGRNDPTPFFRIAAAVLPASATNSSALDSALR
jgi:hypothetical protein